MARKTSTKKTKSDEVVKTLEATAEEQEIFEKVKEEIPEKPQPKPSAPKKLGIIEVAKTMGSYKKTHDPVILAFCKSRGFETEGNREDLINHLKAFGYR